MIIGGASCVWEDILALEELYGGEWNGLIIVANDIGVHWPYEIDAWVSLHGPKLQQWRQLRVQQQRSNSRPFQTWGKDNHRAFVDRVVKPWASGSSGMLAAQVAQELKCTRAVLCGVPMTPTAHFAQTQERFAPEWQQANAHWKSWPRQLGKMQGWVKSMSGRTQELLCAPTLEWLLAE